MRVRMMLKSSCRGVDSVLLGVWLCIGGLVLSCFFMVWFLGSSLGD